MIRDIFKKIDLNLSIKHPLLQVLIGPRQVGKTFGVKQLFDQWGGAKVYETADLLTPPDTSWIALHWKRALNLEQPALLILDEIQKIPNWSESVKLLFDEHRNKVDLKVIILGSASMLLQEGLSESLAGRFELTEIKHWNYSESKEICGLGVPEFILYGGYPESYRYLKDLERWRNFILNSIIEPVISRDILTVRRISKPALFRQTLELALKNPAKEISLQKLLGQLQDSGNVTTIQHYLDLFDQTFLIKSLPKYSLGKLKQKNSSPKLIPYCSALSAAFIEESQLDSPVYGQLFEAAVGANLLKLSGKLYYWRLGDYELDYVFESKGKTYAIEVKSNHKKNGKSLGKFLKEYDFAIPVIINEDNVGSFLNRGLEFFSC